MTGQGRGERISKGRVDAEMIDFSRECMCRFVTGHAYGGSGKQEKKSIFQELSSISSVMYNNFEFYEHR